MKPPTPDSMSGNIWSERNLQNIYDCRMASDRNYGGVIYASQ